VEKSIRSILSVRIASVQWLSSSSELPKGWEAVRGIEAAVEKNINSHERDKDPLDLSGTDTSANRVILASMLERGGNTFLSDQVGATSVPTRPAESEE